MTAKGYCLELGIEEYGKIFQLQKRLNKARRRGVIPDIILLLEHWPCFTIGRKGGRDHILVSDQLLDDEGIRVSLNVCPDLRHFSFIVPCGISRWGVTSMKELLCLPVDIELVRREIRRQVSDIFGLILEDINMGKVQHLTANV